MSNIAQACEDYNTRIKINTHSKQTKKSLIAITGPQWITLSLCFSTL